MPSITYWNRLEVRPRSANISSALSARIRDPIWMLTRQWQFGEFRGEDAAGPAYVEVAATKGKLLGWQTETQEIIPTPPGTPLEPATFGERFTPDLASRVEIGQLFEQLLLEAGVPELVPDFRAAYPISDGSDQEYDHAAARFLQVVSHRAMDGLALFEAAKAAAPQLPDQPAVDPSKEEAARGALTKLFEWIREVWGDFGSNDSPHWNPERLEYAVNLVAAAPNLEATTIRAQPGGDGNLCWHALDAGNAAPGGIPIPAEAVQTVTRSVIPSHVRFRGMPNHRWWDFENSQMNFGSLILDKRDLAKLIVMDFMLVQGNDWFTLPLELETGSLCRVDSLIVHDVFGGTTRIEPADANLPASGQRWTVFSTSAPGGITGYFLLPPGGGSTDSLVVEEVRFLRDEMANMAWGIESATENGLGGSQLGPERERARNTPESTVETPAGEDARPPLHYQIQTTVPEYWIPLLPVALDPAQGEIALELGTMLRNDGTPVLPRGRILQPSSLAGRPYHIREEEVPREGIKVSRVVSRTRGSNGSTHLWVSRRKQIGRGEGSSGLRFDLAAESS